MKIGFIGIALVLGLVLFDSQVAFATDVKGVAPLVASSKPTVDKKPAAVKVQLVDINSAGKSDLTKLPGISAADADKIIAGRPYGSKAWLVSHKILAEDKYPGIRALIIAKQPNKSAADNAALYKKK